MNEKEKQEISLIGRIFSMEAFLILMGFAMLGAGFFTGDVMNYFWGGVILCGSVALHFVRKKDWKKHWEEQELLQQRYNERRRREQEKNGKES